MILAFLFWHNINLGHFLLQSLSMVEVIRSPYWLNGTIQEQLAQFAIVSHGMLCAVYPVLVAGIFNIKTASHFPARH